MKTTLVTAMVGLLLLACGETASTDAGPLVLPDASSDAGSDAGVAPDAGSDAGVDAGATYTCSAGPSLMGAACSAATRTCWSGCMTTVCVDDCVAADPNPDCASCFANNLRACIADVGCEPQWDDYDCCRRANCPDAPASEAVCPGGACDGEFGALEGCGNLRLFPGACAGAVAMCF